MICVVAMSAQTDKAPTPGTSIVYENPYDILSADDCNPSEVYLKKKVKALLAKNYKEYAALAIDITSFKGQKGYSDKDNPSKIIYPYKIELLVYLKRKVSKEGKELTEYSTWEYDSVYEYATKPKKECEFYMLPSSDPKLLSKAVY